MTAFMHGEVKNGTLMRSDSLGNHAPGFQGLTESSQSCSLHPVKDTASTLEKASQLTNCVLSSTPNDTSHNPASSSQWHHFSYYIFLVLETWLANHVLDTDKEITSQNYCLFIKGRFSRGGGVAIFVKHSLRSKLLPFPTSLECTAVKLTVPQLMITCIYLPLFLTLILYSQCYLSQ